MSLIYKIFILFLLSIDIVTQASFQYDNTHFLKLLHTTPITVIAPASGIEDNLLKSLHNIKSLKLILHDNCFDRSRSLFHSNNDLTRFECLKNALFDYNVKIIWCLRGGYGSAKLISMLRQLKKPSQEKYFIGFSDITALHIFLTQEWGWKTIHGSVIKDILDETKERTNFIKIAQIITRTIAHSTINDLVLINHSKQKILRINGKLTGGNLTLVENSIGTPWEIQSANKILFLEDVYIEPYQLDRMLVHLQQAGLLLSVKAIIFGTCGKDNNDMMKALKAFAATMDIPIFKSNRFGHEATNDPIIYNGNSKIIATENNKFDLIMDNF
jgi:muramoyltetrapeptide carboxypeptidase